jgi:hypothetical protein
MYPATPPFSVSTSSFTESVGSFSAIITTRPESIAA